MPCQIISPQLNVGGHIKPEASKGDTNIMINGREITKLEAFILQVFVLDLFKFIGIINFGKTHCIDAIC